MAALNDDLQVFIDTLHPSPREWPAGLKREFENVARVMDAAGMDRLEIAEALRGLFVSVRRLNHLQLSAMRRLPY